MNSDYASFGYLDDPAAFARFPLAPESGRVPAYDGGFDAATVARAERLLAQNIVVSLSPSGTRTEDNGNLCNRSRSDSVL